MKTAVLALFAALVVVVWIPYRVKAAQTNQRTPAAPSSSQGFRIDGGGVPSGYMILGDTDVPPQGYSYSGVSLPAEPGEPDAPSWNTAPSMLVARAELAAASVNGKIYAIGGYNAGHLSSVEQYSESENSWSFRASMPTPRSQLSAAVVGQKVYAIGGFDGSFLGTVEEYDPVLDTWSTRTSMPTPRRLHTTAVVNGRILAIGGHNGSALATVEEYDPTTDTWTTKPSLPIVDSEAAATTHNGIVYVIGGDDGFQPNHTILVYDPETTTWTSRSGPGVYDHAVAVLGGALYSFGGVYGGTFAFNSQVTSWTELQSMPTPRSTLAAAALGGKVYLLGGLAGSPTAVVEVFGVPRRLYAHRKN